MSIIAPSVSITDTLLCYIHYHAEILRFLCCCLSFRLWWRFLLFLLITSHVNISRGVGRRGLLSCCCLRFVCGSQCLILYGLLSHELERFLLTDSDCLGDLLLFAHSVHYVIDIILLSLWRWILRGSWCLQLEYGPCGSAIVSMLRLRITLALISIRVHLSFSFKQVEGFVNLSNRWVIPLLFEIVKRFGDLALVETHWQ